MQGVSYLSTALLPKEVLYSTRPCSRARELPLTYFYPKRKDTVNNSVKANFEPTTKLLVQNKENVLKKPANPRGPEALTLATGAWSLPGLGPLVRTSLKLLEAFLVFGPLVCNMVLQTGFSSNVPFIGAIYFQGFPSSASPNVNHIARSILFRIFDFLDCVFEHIE